MDPNLTLKNENKYLEVSYWTERDFNIAVVGKARIRTNDLCWMDVDEPAKVPAWFLKEAEKYLLMDTARGLAIPVRLDLGLKNIHKGEGGKYMDELKGVDTLRFGITYEIVPLSVTCTKDHDLKGVTHVVKGHKPCVDRGSHDLRVREWRDIGKPILTWSELRGMMKQ